MTPTNTLRRRAPLFLLLLSSLLCLAASACAGAAARTTATLPAMRAAWSAIKIEAEREAAATQSAEGVQAVVVADGAMQAGDVAAIVAAPWPIVHQLAEGDIQRRVAAGQIGPGVAQSLREELRLFASSRSTYTRTTP